MPVSKKTAYPSRAQSLYILESGVLLVTGLQACAGTLPARLFHFYSSNSICARVTLRAKACEDYQKVRCSTRALACSVCLYQAWVASAAF
jgi:hypothetical protein